MAFIPGTSSGDILIPTANNGTYLGGAGNDTYIVTKAVSVGGMLAIADTEGSNKVQITDGLVIASSLFAANAVQLTLSNGAKVQILEAAGLLFEVGANLTAGDTAAEPNQSYAQFAAMLGVAALPTGSTMVSGVPNYIVPTSSLAAVRSAGIGPSAEGMAAEVPVDVYSFSSMNVEAASAGLVGVAHPFNAALAASDGMAH